MPRFARVRSMINKVKEISHEIVTGEKRHAKKQLKANVQDHMHVRTQSCEEALGALSSQLNQLTSDKKEGLIKEFAQLSSELNYLKTHFKTGAEEFDRRLEIIMLKARTMKLIASCEIGVNSDKYAHAKGTLTTLCEEVHNLKNTELNYQTISSQDFVEYRTKLENLETKVQAQFEDSDTIHFG